MAALPGSRIDLRSIQTFLEVCAKSLAFIAALCFALSVVFDWGYLTALELRFSEVPTSLSDHTRSAILWLPITASVFPLAVVFSLFSFIVDMKSIQRTKNAGKDISAYLKKGDGFAWPILAATGVFPFLLWLAFGDRSRGTLVIAGIIFWTFVVAWVTPADYLGARRAYFYRQFLVVLPLIPFSLFMLGYNSGRAGFSPDQKFGTIIAKDYENMYQMKANVARVFDKAVIVINESRNVIVLKPDDIVRIEKAKSSPVNAGVLCSYWHIFCPVNSGDG